MCSDRAVAIGALLLGCVAPLASARADAPWLEARPSTCVALHRGQPCRERVALAWGPTGAGRFCLTVDAATEPLVCWRDDELDAWTRDYDSAEGERYRLVPVGADGSFGEALASARVETAWVYRGGGRGAGGWRLF